MICIFQFGNLLENYGQAQPGQASSSYNWGARCLPGRFWGTGHKVLIIPLFALWVRSISGAPSRKFQRGLLSGWAPFGVGSCRGVLLWGCAPIGVCSFRGGLLSGWAPFGVGSFRSGLFWEWALFEVGSFRSGLLIYSDEKLK